MKEFDLPGTGKISVHGNGLGVPSREDVEKRAREIALIDERNPDDFTDTDWNQARRELLGEVDQTPPEEDANTLKLETEWETTPDNRGHKVERPGTGDDEETIGGHMVSEGVDEAARDQMLEARREEREQEGDIT